MVELEHILIWLGFKQWFTTWWKLGKTVVKLGENFTQY